MDEPCLRLHRFGVSNSHFLNHVLMLTSISLSVFFVAVADWFLFGIDPSLATYAGGSLIIVAFGLLAKEELGHGKH